MYSDYLYYACKNEGSSAISVQYSICCIHSIMLAWYGSKSSVFRETRIVLLCVASSMIIKRLRACASHGGTLYSYLSLYYMERGALDIHWPTEQEVIWLALLHKQMFLVKFTALCCDHRH